MDIQTKDGIILRGIPEGTPEDAIKARIAKIRAERGVPAPEPVSAAPTPERQPDEAEMIAGTPGARFALGAASPFLGAAQLGAEALGSNRVTEQLSRLEDMKRRGSTPAAELIRLKQGRDVLASMPGYEAAVARIDKDIAALGESPSASPQDAGFDVAGLAGTVMSPAVLGAMRIPTAGSVLGRVGQGAALGGAFGAASPVTDTDNFWARKLAQTGIGAALGGVIPPVIDAATVVGQAAKRIVDPLFPGGANRAAARILSEAAGPKRAAIEAELAKNQVLVPGSIPTGPEAAAAAGSPEFAALQRIAAEHRPAAFSDIARAQEAARRASIQTVGQTPADVEAAQTFRKLASDPLYRSARNAGDVVDTKPIIDKITDTLRRNPGNRELVTELMNLRKGLTDKGVPRANAEQVSSTLDGLKAAIAKEDNKFIGGILSNFKDDIANAIPGYQVAQRRFADLSKPVNEMQVGQQLERALTKPVGEGERAGVFGQAMREAPQTIKKATGQPRFENLDEVLKPENLASAKAILADLNRKANFEKLTRSYGQPRAAEAAGAVTLPATGPLDQRYMIFKTILGRVSKGINERTLDTMADALQLPSSTLKLLQRAPTEKQAQLIENIIAAKLGRGAIAAGAELSGESVNQAR